MKRSINFSVRIILFVAVLFSCQQQDSLNTSTTVNLNNPSVPLDVKLAKLYYKTLKVSQGDLVQDGIHAEKNRKYIFFKKAYVSQSKGQSFVEVPMFYNRRTTTIVRPGKNMSSRLSTEETAIAMASFDRFLIYKDKVTGQISNRILRYIPDIDYLKNHNNDISHNQIDKLDKDFSGYIQYMNWDGTPLLLRKFSEGKAVKKVTFNKTQATTNSRKMDEVCEEVTVDIVTEVCYSADPEGGDETCYEFDGTLTYTECYDTDNGGDGGEEEGGGNDTTSPLCCRTTPNAYSLNPVENLPIRNTHKIMSWPRSGFAAIELVAKFFGRDIPASAVISYHCQLHNLNETDFINSLDPWDLLGASYENRTVLSPDDLDLLVKHYFTINLYTDIVNSISNNNPLICQFTNPGDGHNSGYGEVVILTGYNKGPDNVIRYYEYFSPSDQSYIPDYTHAQAFQGIYRITGVK